ncbi:MULTISPECIES: DUF302 domain-containing protein [unclassified Ruegeria]|uniref:DUF302 domain-containing protein n=1 Tax=unclassified Ruegeria TaxID=2625375 RepID=UPI001FD86A8A|nr:MULTISPECIES: DUF302 domain-containing protein [unclassified Ruegeria]
MRRLILACVFSFGGALTAMADDLIKVQSDKSVAEALDALEVAVGNAGATVFARIDHAAGAEKIGTPIPANQVLIFGNPALGTPAIQIDPRAGLFLPLKVQAYEDANGQVWLIYEDPKETLDDLNDVDKSPVIEKMRGALAKLTAAAAQ